MAKKVGGSKIRVSSSVDNDRISVGGGIYNSTSSTDSNVTMTASQVNPFNYNDFLSKIEVNNIGSGDGLYAGKGLNQSLQFKSIVAGSGIVVSHTETDIVLSLQNGNLTFVTNGANAPVSGFTVYKDTVGGVMNFRRLIAGTNISISQSDNDITLNASYPFALGDVNGATNIGLSGEGLFVSKSGSLLEFRNIRSTDNKMTVVTNNVSKTIDLTVNENNLNLANFGGVLSVNKVTGLHAVASTGDYNTLNNKPLIPVVLTDLSNVSGSPNVGQYLRYTSTGWEPRNADTLNKFTQIKGGSATIAATQENDLLEVTSSELIISANTTTKTLNIALSPTSVSPGTYTSANVTVDQFGRITTISSNSAGYADPLTAPGDIIIRNASNNTVKLPVGSNGDVLTVTNGIPSWKPPASSSVNNSNWLGEALSISNGGTGANTAPDARNNLGAAPLVSPVFTGVPTSPTAPIGTANTQIATTEFVNNTLVKDWLKVPSSASETEEMLVAVTDAGTIYPYPQTTAIPFTSSPTASAIMRRDAAGRVDVAAPVFANNVANKGYVDGRALSGFRNKIINGGFDVWQRGSSFNNATMNTGEYLADRWTTIFDATGSDRYFDRHPINSPVANLPSDTKTFARYTVSVAGTGGTYRILEQKIEDVRTIAGQKATITFYAKANANMTLPKLSIFQAFGSGGSPSAGTETIAANNISVTTAWQKFQYIVDVPSVVGKTLGTNGRSSVSFALSLPPSSTFQFDIARVSVVSGDASGEMDPFEPRTWSQEYILCARFYEVGKVFHVEGYASSGANSGGYVTFNVPKRVDPTITQTNIEAINFSSSTNNTYVTTLGFLSFRTSLTSAQGQYHETWAADAEL